MAYILRDDFLKDFPRHRTNGQRGGPIKQVTIHNAASSTTARNLGIYGNYNSTEVSFHYGVDESEVYHLIPLDWTAWHAGTREGNESIGIEITRDMIYTGDQYARAEENAAILAAKILTDAGLTVDALRRHADWIKKDCPHRMFEVERGKTTGRTWAQFKQLVADNMAPAPAPVPEPDRKLVRLAKGTVIHREPPSVVEVETLYTITEEKNGYGKLLSGAGWVLLPKE